MSERKTILLVDDQTTERRLLYHVLKNDHEVVEAGDAGRALELVGRGGIDLAILDMHLPPDTESPEEGIRLQRELHERHPLLPVLIATGDRHRELALEMVQRGVADFLQKPVEPTVLKIVVARALERAALRHELHELRRQVRERASFGNLIGTSPVMQELFAKLDKLTAVSTTVLLLGESGTGKSAIARALHYAGPRADGPFVVVDPSAIPESLLESELFGHVKGAFTGADRDKEGRIRAADGGTLFLDEIGNLGLGVQAKLLLFLDSRTVTPVGARREISVDARLVAATNRDPEAMVAAGEFREDLLYRIQVATFTLPPLRGRVEDIEPLAGHISTRLCREMDRSPVRLTPDALETLRQYPWPGNVRQLRHVLEGSLVLLDGDLLDAGDLTLPAEGPAAAAPAAEGGSLKEQVAGFERDLLMRALRETKGNKAAAGRRLGLDENQVRYLCRKHGLG